MRLSAAEVNGWPGIADLGGQVEPALVVQPARRNELQSRPIRVRDEDRRHGRLQARARGVEQSPECVVQVVGSGDGGDGGRQTGTWIEDGSVVGHWELLRARVV